MADEQVVEQAADLNDEQLQAHIGALAEGRRRARQESSHVIALVAAEAPERLYEHVDVLVDALYRPEAQTRWEVLDALSRVAKDKVELVANACDGAESALFDETSSAVRLAAFRFLTCYGAAAPERSDEVWHLVDEAIQCYHGDPEYRDMLGCLLDFARGNLSEATREALVARVGFDAAHGHEYIKAFSGDILRAAGADVPQSDEPIEE